MPLNKLVNTLNTAGPAYALYFRRAGQAGELHANCHSFRSASLIKIPILLAWAWLERQGQVRLDDACDLDAEPQVGGAGFARRMRARKLPWHDVLLMMIATSDNLCTNLAVAHTGIPRLNEIFTAELGLTGTRLERRLMDFEARARGLDNWVSPEDCVRFFDLVRGLPEAQRAWVEPMLAACTDRSLLLRDTPRDSLRFLHKTGSVEGVLHDWGTTRDCDIFLLMNGVADEDAANRLFAQAGRLLTGEPDSD